MTSTAALPTMLLASLFVLSAGCGGQTSAPPHGSSSSGGSSGSSSGAGSSSGSPGGSSSGSSEAPEAGFGCEPFTTTTMPVQPKVCEPQLTSVSSCGNQPCSWMVEIPCFSDAGSDFDGGTYSCGPCEAVMPQGAEPPGRCQAFDGDAGTVSFQCGGCGI
jgi:hypothetical protein